MIMPVPLNPQQTFEAYKFNHPDWNNTGRLICHECGGSVILRVHDHLSIYAHICRTCGTKLYYTSNNEMENKKANEAFWRSTMAPRQQQKTPGEIKKKSRFKAFCFFVGMFFIINLCAIFLASQL